MTHECISLTIYQLQYINFVQGKIIDTYFKYTIPGKRVYKGALNFKFIHPNSELFPSLITFFTLYAPNTRVPALGRWLFDKMLFQPCNQSLYPAKIKQSDAAKAKIKHAAVP